DWLASSTSRTGTSTTNRGPCSTCISEPCRAPARRRQRPRNAGVEVDALDRPGPMARLTEKATEKGGGCQALSVGGGRWRHLVSQGRRGQRTRGDEPS